MATMRVAIVNKLLTVSGVENVFDYVYWTDNWQDIYTKFAAGGRINTWMVGLASNPENEIDAGNRTKTYVWNLFVYYSFKSTATSSRNLEDLCESVTNEFLEGYRIIDGATIENTVLLGIENAVYAGTPAHRGQIQVTIKEIIAQTISCG
jgi:hypothetical protein